MSREAEILSGLIGLLIISALLVIYSKYQSRLVFVEIQKQERALDYYEVQWGQLQLEMTTLAEHNRVEQVAREKLKLSLPVQRQTIYIKP